MLTKKGFTLLEALLAVLLFAVGIVAVVGLFSIGLVSSLDAENTSIAMNLAQGRMEETRNLDFASIGDEDMEAVDGFPKFQREVLVTEPLAGLKKVTVNVYGTFKSGEVKVPLVTYISKN